jgi:YidC/Oxa1 family membrane protein insertase
VDKIFGPIGSFFGTLFSPIGALFHVVFYLPIYNVLMLLYQGVHAIVPAAGFPSFAIAIFLLTVAVRLCLYPLTRKQLQSSRAMQALAPQLQQLRERHRNNPQELMAAQQALYREHGVSMYGGCLPLLIQMPFLYGLYFSFYTALLPRNTPLPTTDSCYQAPIPHQPYTELPATHLCRVNQDIYHFLPPLAHLPNTAFLWADLAHPDPLKILPILAGVLTFLQLRMAQPVRKPPAPGQRPDPTTQSMASMQYVMPIMTAFIGLSFPAGLAFYWCVSTAFSAVQQYFLTGWGSLFVGIPGMQHLVPEPQSPPTPPARSPRPARVVDATPTSASQSPAGLSGLGSLGALLRQLTAPPKAPDGTNGTAPTSNGKANGTTEKPLTVETDFGDPYGTKGGARRPRAERSAPMLVKPSTPAPTGGSGSGAQAAPAKGASSQPQSQPPSGGGRGSGATRRPPGGQAGKRRSGGRPKGGR